jgi:hypothetical protein
MAQHWIQTWWFSAAVMVLGIHLLFNAWYVLGAALTSRRPGLEILHLLSLVYGVIAENASFACPLTILEKWCQARAGLIPYAGNFELHYLRALVAPHFPGWLLGYGAVGVFVVNVAIYARRFAHRYAASHRPAH